MKRLRWWHLSWMPQNRKMKRLSGLPWGTDL